ncbi:MAG: hypothetical protein ACLQK4_00525 [Acidimicrobiales bacterium]|jgi:hypothetical protein
MAEDLRPLSDRNLGWLRYIHRKATTTDSWERDGRPHDHWDNRSDPPMTSWRRFDLLDSCYAVALMADRTPAWREVYDHILDELIWRHTGWWAAEDWLTQIGHDPERSHYPPEYHALIPSECWGKYDVPGWTANGAEPWGLQMDPIGADGNLFFKGFFLVMLGLYYRTCGDPRWNEPFEIVRDGENTFTWWHSRIAEHLAEQWRAHPEGCHCENTKIWPYCLAGAGLGLQLHDLCYGTDHHEVFRDWWDGAGLSYLNLGGTELPSEVTLYFDPEIDHRHLVPAGFGGIPAIYLAPQVPADARRLWDAARAQTGMLEVHPPISPVGPRFTATSLFLAREWGVTDLAEALQDTVDANFEPTWDRRRGEFTWGFGLEEEHPRGQYNALMAAAEAVTEGAWWSLANTSTADRFAEPTVTGVDFPTVALRQAIWDPRDESLVIEPVGIDAATSPATTSFQITNLPGPERFVASGRSGTTSVSSFYNVVQVTTTVGTGALTIRPR